MKKTGAASRMQRNTSLHFCSPDTILDPEMSCETLDLYEEKVMSGTSIEVFYAYAPEDEPYALELEKHLTLLQRGRDPSSDSDEPE